MMETYEQQVQDAMNWRRSQRGTLSRMKDDLTPEAYQRKQDEIEASFNAKVKAVQEKATKEESTLQADVSKARHAVRLAKYTVPDAQRMSFQTTRDMLPALSSDEVAEFYEDAVLADDVGAQIAIETYKVEAPDDRAKGKLIHLAMMIQEQQAARSVRQVEALSHAEARLQAWRDAFQKAMEPAMAERTRESHREPMF